MIRLAFKKCVSSVRNMTVSNDILSNLSSCDFKKCWLERFCSKFATCHSTIKMKSADGKSSRYIDFNIGNDDKDPKFEFDDHLKATGVDTPKSAKKADLPRLKPDELDIDKLKTVSIDLGKFSNAVKRISLKRCI